MRKQELHGMRNTRQYNIWAGILQKCNNKSLLAYKYYGKRGITYDKKWNKFSNFWNDMKKGYSDDLTLERMDNNGNYCKKNCKWATRKEQANNKRNNVKITHDGKTQNLKEWADELHIDYKTLWTRIRRHKMSFSRAISKPVVKISDRNVIQLNLKGEFINSFKTIAEASKKTGAERSSISRVIGGKRKKAGGCKWTFLFH